MNIRNYYYPINKNLHLIELGGASGWKPAPQLWTTLEERIWPVKMDSMSFFMLETLCSF